MRSMSLSWEYTFPALHSGQCTSQVLPIYRHKQLISKAKFSKLGMSPTCYNGVGPPAHQIGCFTLKL